VIDVFAKLVGKARNLVNADYADVNSR
jgi:hypothetical protein